MKQWSQVISTMFAELHRNVSGWQVIERMRQQTTPDKQRNKGHANSTVTSGQYDACYTIPKRLSGW